MAAIRRADTKPEMLIRRGIHAHGFRYRLHDRKLPGRPDLTLSKYNAVIFVNGCFWHGHDCPMFRWPATRQEFWRDKITGNMERDTRNIAALLSSGWRVALVRTEAASEPAPASVRQNAAIISPLASFGR